MYPANVNETMRFYGGVKTRSRNKVKALPQEEEKKGLPSSNVSPFVVLKDHRVVAVVGASRNPEKDAHTVPLYLKAHGYRVVPINPTVGELFGEKTYSSLLDMPPEVAKQIEVVDVFRPKEELPEIAKQVVELKKRVGKTPVFWAQVGLESEEAKRILLENDIPYIMNMCMRATHQLGVQRGHF